MPRSMTRRFELGPDGLYDQLHFAIAIRVLRRTNRDGLLRVHTLCQFSYHNYEIGAARFLHECVNRGSRPAR